MVRGAEDLEEEWLKRESGRWHAGRFVRRKLVRDVVEALEEMF